MNLVYNIDPVFRSRGGENRVFTQISNMVNAVVRCRVNFKNVKVGIVFYAYAVFALVAWFTVIGI